MPVEMSQISDIPSDKKGHLRPTEFLSGPLLSPLISLLHIRPRDSLYVWSSLIKTAPFLITPFHFHFEKDHSTYILNITAPLLHLKRPLYFDFLGCWHTATLILMSIN